MGTVLLVGAIWLFLLALALGILRTAGLAERDAERRLQERRRESRPRRRPAEAGRRAARIGVVVAALPLAASAGASDADAASCKTGRGGAPLTGPSATPTSRRPSVSRPPTGSRSAGWPPGTPVPWLSSAIA